MCDAGENSHLIQVYLYYTCYLLILSYLVHFHWFYQWTSVRGATGYGRNSPDGGWLEVWPLGPLV